MAGWTTPPPPPMVWSDVPRPAPCGMWAVVFGHSLIIPLINPLIQPLINLLIKPDKRKSIEIQWNPMKSIENPRLS